jgi:hypothetical protein
MISDSIIGQYISSMAGDENRCDIITLQSVIDEKNINRTNEIVGLVRKHEKAMINSRRDVEINYLCEVIICTNPCHLIFYTFLYK